MCQVHRATSAFIQSWWLDGQGRKKLLERAANKIAKDQRRIARARKSHTKKTRQKLRRLGIRLTKVPKCKWNSS